MTIFQRHDHLISLLLMLVQKRRTGDSSDEKTEPEARELLQELQAEEASIRAQMEADEEMARRLAAEFEQAEEAKIVCMLCEKAVAVEKLYILDVCCYN
jgi:hypothetical protein